MIARACLLAAVAVAVCACASPVPERTSLQGGPFYMVGDNVAPSRASTAAGPMEAQGEFSMVKRIYWFFAGR